MRKWVSERLKRRKKKTEEHSSEPSQTPLQPAYFAEEAAAPESAGPAAEPASTAEPEVAEPAQEASPRPTPVRMSNSNARGRGRRRRGRSNRGGRSTPAPVDASAQGQTAIAEPGTAKPVTPMTRPPKGTVILAIGLPGSGKSSWFKRHNITPLSSDMLRSLLFDDPTEQRFQDLIFSNLRSMLKARLIAHRPMNYVDTTNLTPHDRHSWIKLAKDFGYETQAVFFDVPLDVCLERNQKRDRVVPEDVMRRFAEKLKPPTFEEGFSKITVVRVKQKEASAS